RFFLISTHYRSPIDLGDFEPGRQDLPSGLVNVHKGHKAFVRFAERYQRVTGKGFYELAAPTRVKEGRSFRQPEFGDFLARFREHMDDDFNTGGAVGVLFDLARALNRLADAGKLEDPAARDAGARADFEEGALLLKELGQILGLFREPEALTPSSEVIAQLHSQPTPHAQPRAQAEAYMLGQNPAPALTAAEDTLVAGLLQVFADLDEQ